MRRFNAKNLDIRKLAGTIVGGIFFLCCILYFTYAFYQWESGNTIVDLTISDLSTTCSLGPDVNATDIGPVLSVQDGVKAEFSITNDSDDAMTFDIQLNITSISENLLVDYFNYEIALDTAGGTNYDYNATVPGSFADLQVGVNDIFSFSVPAGKTYSYQFIVYIDGTVYNDANIQQNSLVSNLLIGNCGEVAGTASQKVQALYNDGSDLLTVNIGGVTTNPTVTLNTNKKIMLDNNGEYRYYGANPNNYVQFNDELWRIISVSNVKSSTTDTVGEMRMKIIRDESIGNYSWDSSDSSVDLGYGVNDWTQADLMTELNTIYYNSQSGTCYVGAENTSEACDFTSIGLDSTARNMIDNALWYLGGSATNDSLYADDYYTFERGTVVYDCTTNDGACPRATKWVGQVGLIYPSDYAYATDLNLCKNYGTTYNNDTNCTVNDWLLRDSAQWTLSPYADDGGNVFAIRNSRITIFLPSTTYIIRPVVYLKSAVTITGGAGTSTNPYTLSIS